MMRRSPGISARWSRVAALFPHRLDPHQESGLIACIAQFRGDRPAAALLRDLAGGFHLDLAQAANGFEVVAKRSATLAARARRTTCWASRRGLFQAAQVEVVGHHLIAAR